MSMGIGHFALGASTTMVAFHMLPLRIRARMRIAQIFIVIVGGAWAMLPDIAQHTKLLHYINDHFWTKIGLFAKIGVPSLTRFVNRISAFHDSPWANICFLHRLMDTVDTADSLLASSALVVVMLAVVSIILVRELQEQRAARSE